MGPLAKFLWGAITTLGPWLVVVVVGGLLLAAFWPEVKRAVAGPVFVIRPVPGQSLSLPWEHRGPVIAKLAIKNASGAPKKNCSVRLMEAFTLRFGHVSRWVDPSIEPTRGDTFLLRWANGEQATADGKHLDIPSDGAERFAEVLMVEVDDENRARSMFCAADRSEMPMMKGIGIGLWCKLKIKVASEDGAFEDAEFLAGCSDHPGPIILWPWIPHGERALVEQRKEMEEQRAKSPPPLPPPLPQPDP